MNPYIDDAALANPFYTQWFDNHPTNEGLGAYAPTPLGRGVLVYKKGSEQIVGVVVGMLRQGTPLTLTRVHVRWPGVTQGDYVSEPVDGIVVHPSQNWRPLVARGVRLQKCA